MIKATILKPHDVTQQIKDGMTVCTIAMTLVSAAESILKDLEKSFMETGHPCDLTVLHSCGQGDRKDGLLHLAHEKLTKRIIGSHWGLMPGWMQLIADNKVEAYCMPQGQIAQLYRSMACGLPGKISKVGLGTFVDPRYEGGKMNSRTRPLEDLIDVMKIDGEEYLFYKKVPIDICIIRGTECDEMGNLTTDEEAMKLEVIEGVLACKRFGGKVFAQVKRVVQNGTLNPKSVVVPGVFIDGVVVCDNPLVDHRQSSSWYFDPSYSGQSRVVADSIEPLPLTVRKVIGRRALEEVESGNIINLGTGIPNDVVGNIANEENIGDDIMITVESGIYGGVQSGGIDFGVGKNLCAMITHVSQMDYYDGAGVDVTFMGFGELDGEGNVNATKMGKRCTGAGGFLDITQNAKKIIFCGTFTASGCEFSFENKRLHIKKEGSIRKMVKQVAQYSFNGKIAREKNQEVWIVTERAVFKLVREGVMLMEIAAGADLQKDILDLMDFKPLISDELKTIDTDIYAQGKYGLKSKIMNETRS
ncbi:MAG: hypothetical protein PUA61_08920 [Succinatimonas hippei]|nr:hypothetical protein [Succinatimonas hippei]